MKTKLITKTETSRVRDIKFVDLLIFGGKMFLDVNHELVKTQEWLDRRSKWAGIIKTICSQLDPPVAFIDGDDIKWYQWLKTYSYCNKNRNTFNMWALNGSEYKSAYWKQLLGKSSIDPGDMAGRELKNMYTIKQIHQIRPLAETGWSEGMIDVYSPK